MAFTKLVEVEHMPCTHPTACMPNAGQSATTRALTQQDHALTLTMSELLSCVVKAMIRGYEYQSIWEAEVVCCALEDVEVAKLRIK